MSDSQRYHLNISLMKDALVISRLSKLWVLGKRIRNFEILTVFKENEDISLITVQIKDTTRCELDMKIFK